MSASRLLCVFVALVLSPGALVTDATAQDIPKPSIVQKDWQFKFEFDHPRPIAVKNLRGKYEWFWFMTYKVTNKTGRERLFIPEIVIATDEGDILQAGQKVPTRVFDAIKRKVGNRLLDSPADVVGRILQGEDNAKESAAIWPATEQNVDELTVFVGGLSGETRVISYPDPKDTAKTVTKLVTKTLQIDYDLPGKPQKPDQQAVVYKRKKWIMR